VSRCTGLDHSDTLLFSERLAGYSAAEAPVRWRDASVASLDLHALGFARGISAGTGRPPCDRAARLKLCVQGYRHRVHSARTPGAAGQRNGE